MSVFVRNNNGDFVYDDDELVTSELIRRKFKTEGYIFEKQLIQEFPLCTINPDTVLLYEY